LHHDHENPTHPGEVLREDVIAELGLTVKDAAERLGMSRTALSRVLNCRAAVSSDLALRLEQAGVSTADTWLTMQLNYDLAQARQQPQPAIRAFGPVAAHA
jgi:addiction module HigA family antidote